MRWSMLGVLFGLSSVTATISSVAQADSTLPRTASTASARLSLTRCALRLERARVDAMASVEGLSSTHVRHAGDVVALLAATENRKLTLDIMVELAPAARATAWQRIERDGELVLTRTGGGLRSIVKVERSDEGDPSELAHVVTLVVDDCHVASR